MTVEESPHRIAVVRRDIDKMQQNLFLSTFTARLSQFFLASFFFLLFLLLSMRIGMFYAHFTPQFGQKFKLQSGELCILAAVKPGVRISVVIFKLEVHFYSGMRCGKSGEGNFALEINLETRFLTTFLKNYVNFQKRRRISHFS